MLPDEIKPAMEGVVPSSIVTCSLSGSPNVTSISQIYYVDENHVALSHQSFNKTHRNIRENPHVALCIATHDEPYKYVLAEGLCEIARAGVTERAASISTRYYGADRGR